MLEVLDTLTILIACAMVGNEFAVAAFVHPSLSKLSEPAHKEAAAKLAGILGRVMPFWYALTLVLCIADLAVKWHADRQINTGILAACALWVIAIVSTILWLVPINNRIAAGVTQPAPFWLADRKRWDLLHCWRVLLLSIAAACLVLGILSKEWPQAMLKSNAPRSRTSVSSFRSSMPIAGSTENREI